MYPTEFEEITRDEANKISSKQLLYHMEQIEQSEFVLAEELFDFRWDYGPDTFNQMTDDLGMTRGVAQSYLNIGLGNFMRYCKEQEEREDND